MTSGIHALVQNTQDWNFCAIRATVNRVAAALAAANTFTDMPIVCAERGVFGKKPECPIMVGCIALCPPDAEFRGSVNVDLDEITLGVKHETEFINRKGPAAVPHRGRRRSSAASAQCP